MDAFSVLWDRKSEQRTNWYYILLYSHQTMRYLQDFQERYVNKNILDIGGVTERRM